MATTSGQPDSPISAGRWAPALMLSAVYFALVLPMVLTGAGYAPPAWDEEQYHLPIIRTMVAQWPSVDVVNYDSATTPGYHLLMAAVLKTTDSVMVMRLVNAALSWSLVMVVYRAARRAFAVAPMHSGWIAAALTLPLVASQYFLGGAIWLTTDNAALLFVTLALSGAVLMKFTPGRGVVMGVLAALAVLVRQLHVWVAAPIGLAGLLASPLARFVPSALRDDGNQAPRSWRNLAFGVIGAAIPVIVLGVFVVLWGGLIPVSPKVRDQHLQGMNPATFAFALSLTGVLGVFFLTVATGGVIGHLRRLRMALVPVIFAAAIGFVSAVAVPTFWVDRVRDTGFLWKAVKIAPVVDGRSVVLAVLAPVGAVVIVLLYRTASEAGRRVPALVLLLAMLAWVCAQSANIMCWHRYFEPLILIALAWISAMGMRRESGRWNMSGPVVLAVLLLAVSAITLYRPAIVGP